MRRLRALVGRVEAWEARRFGRTVLGVLFRTDVLVLTVAGRRTGRPRSTPVAHVGLDDGSWLVAGGAGGRSRVDWVANLRATDRATATVRREEHDVAVREPVGDERERLRALAGARWPRLAAYERRSGRPAPLFVLSPSIRPQSQQRQKGWPAGSR